MLTAGRDFGLSGSVANLGPGGPASLLLTATNPYPIPITIINVTVTISAAPAGCPLANFTIAGQSFAGRPPTLTITALSRTVPASGSASFGVSILLTRSAPNICQDVTLKFRYGGTATSARHRRHGGGIGTQVMTVIGSHPDPSLFGHRVTFTADVLARTPSAVWRHNPPRGTVTFYLCTDPAILPPGSAPAPCRRPVVLGGPVPLNGPGLARLSTASLPGGRHTIFAIFRPASPGYAPSYSGTISQFVRFTARRPEPGRCGSVTGGRCPARRAA
jgi:Bacterial Ig-like domain (group 3)